MSPILLGLIRNHFDTTESFHQAASNQALMTTACIANADLSDLKCWQTFQTNKIFRLVTKNDKQPNTKQTNESDTSSQRLVYLDALLNSLFLFQEQVSKERTRLVRASVARP